MCSLHKSNFILFLGKKYIYSVIFILKRHSKLLCKQQKLVHDQLP